MDVECGGNIMFDLVKKGAKLARPMMGLTYANAFAGPDHRFGRDSGDEGGKQGGRAVAFVIMGAPFDLTLAHR
jgi:hypothetical protein